MNELPNGFEAHWNRYVLSCQTKGYTSNSIDTWTANIRPFISWCDDRGLHHPNAITYPILLRYQRYVALYRKSDGEPLSTHTQSVRITALRGFFRWLTKERYILYNPASDIELPRKQRRLPKVILTTDEVESVLNQPNLNDAYGIRDRAILEVLYSTGMRRMELINLKLDSIDYKRGIVFIEQGKGQKDRVIPIGERALAWLKRYRDDLRPELCCADDKSALFLNKCGRPFGKEGLSRRVKQYIDDAQIGKQGSCHLLRHAMATHMLENGADIRYIQEMLGHARLDTTQIYTQVSIVKLQEIHRATHPAKVKEDKHADSD